MIRTRRSRLWWLAAGLLSLALAAGIGRVAFHHARASLAESLDQSLILTRRGVEAEIERFRYLPRLALEDARVRAVISAPDDAAAVAAANRYLDEAARLSGAVELLLIDRGGTAIAAVDSRHTEDYVGNNYGFRPYFREALAEGAGRFYGIGATTGRPGYFLSTRLDLAGGETAVMVVKLDLLPLQTAWEEAGAATALADGAGVVFLSGEPAWRYRPLFPLSADVSRRLEGSRAYPGEDLAARPPVLGEAARALPLPTVAAGGQRLLLRRLDIPSEGWTLVTAASLAPAVTFGATAAAITALSALAVLAAGQVIAQRLRIVHLRLRQGELLERRVQTRTRALAHEVEVRTRAEADLRAAQHALIHTEKMAALGRMSAAIVHEISQPLAAMEASLAATVLSRKLTDPASEKRIDSARGHVRRVQKIIKDLRLFSRKGRPELRPTSIDEAIRSAIELAEPRAQSVPVEIAFRPEGPAPVILAAQLRLEQVFVNLLLNAIDALDGRADPTLVIERYQAGDRVLATVIDNGSGIPAPLLDRITEPFFTTKAGSEGLGLGLAITQTIIEDFGGTLDITSRPDEGTRVAVSFPLAADQTVAS